MPEAPGPRHQAVEVVARKIYDLHGPSKDAHKIAELQAQDIVRALMGSPEVLRNLAVVSGVVICDWCEATTTLDDEGMVCFHVRPDDGAHCPGVGGDDFVPCNRPPRHLVNAAAPAMRRLLRRVWLHRVDVDEAIDMLLDWPPQAYPQRSSTVNRKLLPLIVLAGALLAASLAAVVVYVASLISAMWTS